MFEDTKERDAFRAGKFTEADIRVQGGNEALEE